MYMSSLANLITFAHKMIKISHFFPGVFKNVSFFDNSLHALHVLLIFAFFLSSSHTHPFPTSTPPTFRTMLL